jgi:hypothetical protein
MPQEGFETMIPVFEGAKTVHASDRAATVIGRKTFYFMLLLLKIIPYLVSATEN